MNKFQDLQPQEVFRFFQEISAIPRCSGEEQKISDYLVDFAKKRSLEVKQDESLNIVIKKPATPGYESAPTVILQGHMDMVCEKTASSSHNFSCDPIEWRVTGDQLRANQTTLGADNGIAVAFGLALLDSQDLPHPALEFLVTTKEETGLEGANALDASFLSGSILLNLDSEEEGIFTVSCAGGLNHITEFEYESLPAHGSALQINIGGLKGGHSGMEISRQRANAIKLLARLLYQIQNSAALSICSISGGSKHNAIASQAQALFSMDPKDLQQALTVCQTAVQEIKNEYRVEEPDLSIDCALATLPGTQLEKDLSARLIHFLNALPYGVQTFSKDIEGLVETSVNIGILTQQARVISITSSVRSSVGSAKEEVAGRIESIAALSGGKTWRRSSYPAWQYQENSPVRDLCLEIYRQQYGKEAQIDAIHAGLECGLLLEKLSGADAISFGPTMADVHTPYEHLSVSSVRRVWEFLCRLLFAMK